MNALVQQWKSDEASERHPSPTRTAVFYSVHSHQSENPLRKQRASLNHRAIERE